MNVLFIGDIVGKVGREAVKKVLPTLISKYQPHIIIANGENAASGRGITRPIATEFFEWGIHGITMGNHTWDNKNIFEWIEDEPRIVRPANFSEAAPGQGSTIIKANGKELAIINLQGRTFLPPIDCPFAMADHLIATVQKRTKAILIDFHAEATSEKIALGWHLDGKASLVVGTHTHVQTNDDTILPQGTAYITDVGMVGSKEGVLGMEKESVLYRFQTQMPTRFVVDEGAWHLHAVHVKIDELTGHATAIEKIRLTEEQWLLL
ncbi:TIGR00282 family metallophosphoesterase [Paenibacillus yanchengensis]|uniref:TIGR00282 family metallophosphoesterase n=1 Tax=Paenibacillus yanchengensis TaxID=2035833 RepID=A0ABW4YM89_9BACL